MAKRKPAGSEFVAKLGIPIWPLGLILGVLFFGVLRYAFPALAADDRLLKPVAEGLSTVAPVLLILGAFLSLVGLIKTYYRRLLYRRQQARTDLASLSWQDFERLVGEYFRRHGFNIAERGGSGGDGGVDLVLARQGETYLVQCKRWRKKAVGVDTVRELVGAVSSEGAANGYLVLSGQPTSAAQELAQRTGITIIDGDLLAAELREVSISEEPSIDTESVEAPEPPTCPDCGSIMKRRTARKGKQAGTEFWGCSDFPNCRGTRPM